MKNTQQTVLNAAIVAALGLVGQNVAATGADLTSASSPAYSPIKIAKELPASGTLNDGGAGNKLNVKISVPAGYTVDTANKYLNVKVNLLGGAKFAAVPVLTCNTGSTINANSMSTTISVGGNGQSNATFVASPSAAGTVLPTLATDSYCTLSAASISYSGTTDKSISATVEFRDGATDVKTGAAGTYVSFVKGLSATITAAPQITIDVASSSNKFLISNTTVVTALLGVVQYSAVAAGGFSADMASSLDATVGTTPSYSVTISGPALAGASSVFLSSNTASCNTPVYSATPTGSASTSLTMTAITPGNIQGGLAACLLYSGTAPIIEGQITATISRNAENNGYQLDFAPIAANLALLKKNGATVEVDFLTNPAGFPTFVRFTNPTSLSGNVLVDAYNDDGAKGTATWGFVLGAGKSIMYPMDVIITKTGIAASTTAATDGALPGNKFRLIVNAEFPTLGVQALNLSKDGNSFGQLTGSRSK